MFSLLGEIGVVEEAGPLLLSSFPHPLPSLAKPVKKEKDEEAERQAQFEEKLKEEGVDPERYQRLHQTQVPFLPSLTAFSPPLGSPRGEGRQEQAQECQRRR